MEALAHTLAALLPAAFVGAVTRISRSWANGRRLAGFADWGERKGTRVRSGVPSGRGDTVAFDQKSVGPQVSDPPTAGCAATSSQTWRV